MRAAASGGFLIERLYMDPSPVASTPFFGDEVRLLTYIRPLTAASVDGARPWWAIRALAPHCFFVLLAHGRSRVLPAPVRPVRHPSACL